MIDHEQLKLKATNKADIDVLSAMLQDSIYKFNMCSYHDEHQKCFRMIFNRFCWENADREQSRTHIGLYIHNVESIFVNHEISNNSKIQYLNLLMCYCTDENDIYFIFSENKKIRIHVGEILVYAKDLHTPWPTHNIPSHKANL